jgi:signal transduction histidine kinase
VAVLNDVTSLKELDRLQRQMIELTTHQLKNPLQAAMLHLDELEDLGEDVLTEDMRYDLSVIWDQLERMQRLVASILNLERLQSRSVRATEQVDFSQVTLSAVSALRRQAEAKHIQLEVKIGDNLPLVRGDPSELTEAVTNLVDNAIKYTPPQGQVQVEAWGVDGSILLRVNDTGIGIAESEHERIFDRFYRIEQPGTEQISGTGMGLSLVKAIIERHHGRVWLESEPNAGTTFYVSLPGLK